MFCPKCGAETPGGDRFCRACGGALATPAAPAPAALPPSDPAQIGSLFADRYEVRRELGRGGMGIVYEAIDTRLKDRIALKVLMPHHAANPTVYERFLQEVRTARQLSHPNIVKVYDLGEASRTIYFTMEYLEGRDLDEILEDEGPFDLETTVDVLGKVCAALDVAHKANLVHRDVKPENVFMTLGGEIKVLDFGVAKVLDGSTTGMTGSMIGTPSYMAPEQVSQGGKVDYWTDIYALGVVTFRMLTGELPFKASDPIEAALQHIHALPPTPRSVNPAIPAGVEDAILRALAKDPARRQPSALAFAEELRRGAGLAREAASATIDLKKVDLNRFRAPDPTPPASPAIGARPRMTGRSLTPGAPLFPAPATARWSVISQGRILGDLDRPTIEQWIADHKLTATDHAKADGGKWFPLEVFPDFVDALGAVVPLEEIPDIVPAPVRARARQEVIARAIVWVVLITAFVTGYGFIRVWTKSMALEAPLRLALDTLYYDEGTILDLNGKPTLSQHYATSTERSAALLKLAQERQVQVRPEDAVLVVDSKRALLRWIVPLRIPVMFVPIRREITVEKGFPLREKQLIKFYSDPPDPGVRPEGFTWEDVRNWIAERHAQATGAGVAPR
ncbi:MAG: protein kinase [bacterium]